eukprot:6192863-Pleurochrysis_carterae.AAC.2
MKYETEQAQRRKEYLECRQGRLAQDVAKTKLGYLQWLATWWRGEFDRLDQATGFKFEPGGASKVRDVY